MANISIPLHQMNQPVFNPRPLLHHDDQNMPEPPSSPPPYLWYKQRYEPTEIVPPTRDQIDVQPWRYAGYRALSMWAGAADDTMVLRRFNVLNARVIMYMQDEIARIESDLDELDRCNMNNPKQLHNGTFRTDWDHDRNYLMGLLVTKLKTYNDFVLSHRQLRANSEAPSYAVKNMKTYMFNQGDGEDGMIDLAEAKFLDTAGDLVALVPKDRPPMRRFLDRFANWHPYLLCCAFREKANRLHHYPKWYPNKTTRYHNDSSIDAFMTIIVTTIGLAALIGSLWVLKGQVTESSRLWTISGFLAGFTVFISVVTVAKPFEALAATAAVAAVLMVFMQLGPGSNAGSIQCTSTQCSVLANTTASMIARDLILSYVPE